MVLHFTCVLLETANCKHTLTLFVWQWAGAQWEEEELRGGAELREGSEEDGKDRGEGSDSPAAHQRQNGCHPTECGERSYIILIC